MGRNPKNSVFQVMPISNTQVLEMGQVLVLELMSPAYKILGREGWRKIQNIQIKGL